MCNRRLKSYPMVQKGQLLSRDMPQTDSPAKANATTQANLPSSDSSSNNVKSEQATKRLASNRIGLITRSSRPSLLERERSMSAAHSVNVSRTWLTSLNQSFCHCLSSQRTTEITTGTTETVIFSTRAPSLPLTENCSCSSVTSLDSQSELSRL